MRKRTSVVSLAILTALAGAIVALGGCASMGYYWQGFQGQMGILNAARPIDDWLTDESTSPALRQRLQAAQQMRRFASQELGLPDNASYTHYAQLPRKYAVWNVVAAPPDSLDSYMKELREVEESHAQYLGVGNLLKLSQPEFIDRLLRALVSRLRIVFERALNEIEHWSRAVAGQIDTQLRERRRGLKRRLASIERAVSAATGLDERIADIHMSLLEVQQEQSVFNEHVDKLLQNASPVQEPPMLMAM